MLTVHHANFMRMKLLAIMAAALLVNGCRTPTGEYDPVKTKYVTDTVQLVVSTPITILLVKSGQKNPAKAEAQAAYFRSIGAAFCELKRTKKFDPVALTVKLDLIFKDLVREDIEVLLIKNAVVVLYGSLFASRLDAELPEESWMLHVTGVLCDSIGQSLKDSGYEAVTPP